MNPHRSTTPAHRRVARQWLVATSIALACVAACSQTNGPDALSVETASSPHAASDVTADGQDTGGEPESAASNGAAEASAETPPDDVAPTEPPGSSPGPPGPSQERPPPLDQHGCAIDWQSRVEAEEWAALRSELPCIFDSPATVTPEVLDFAQELDERARDELGIDAEDPDLVAPTDPLPIAPDDAGEP